MILYFPKRITSPSQTLFCSFISFPFLTRIIIYAHTNNLDRFVGLLSNEHGRRDSSDLWAKFIKSHTAFDTYSWDTHFQRSRTTSVGFSETTKLEGLQSISQLSHSGELCVNCQCQLNSQVSTLPWNYIYQLQSYHHICLQEKQGATKKEKLRVSKTICSNWSFMALHFGGSWLYLATV